MPRANQDNVKQWLEKTDIDYFTHFVKAWIPFNAWYRLNYDTLRTEREILDEVKRDGNRMRSRIIAKLGGSDPDSQEIGNQIAALHRRLSADPLEGRNGTLSFERVLIGPNSQRFAEHKHGHWYYRVERVASSKNVVSSIKSNRGRVHTLITQADNWNVEEFELHPDYLALNPEDKARLRQCYEAAHPSCFASLLATSPPPENSILMDGIYFTHDKSAIFSGLIEILYSMRNMLFHGEIVPDTQTNRTYEPAYHLVRHLTSCIV